MGARALAALLLCGCGGPQWVTVTDSLDRVVLTVGGSGDDVVIAGGGQRNGSPSLLKKLSKGKWSTVELPGTETLWWVGSGFVVGEQGAIYRLSGEKLTAPTTATLFGVWGASESEVWAVGGSPLGGGENDVILRFDGTGWSKVPSPEPLDVAYFKVWGSARDDVFIVGELGVALHYDGTVWKRVTTPTRSTLLTVAGSSSSDVWAVGGPPATLLHWDGSAWSDVALPFEASGLSGVSATKSEVLVVGLGGVRWRRTSAWVDESGKGDLHSVWLAPGGDAWAVGGNYLALDPATVRSGIVMHRSGAAVPAP